MTELKHTPSPWFQSHRQIPNDENGMYATQVYTEDGETIATLSWYKKPLPPRIINGKKVKVTGTYREANAKLIAAAPELLEALQNLENDNNAIPPHAWDKVQKAIKKATE